MHVSPTIWFIKWFTVKGQSSQRCMRKQFSSAFSPASAVNFASPNNIHVKPPFSPKSGQFGTIQSLVQPRETIKQHCKSERNFVFSVAIFGRQTCQYCFSCPFWTVWNGWRVLKWLKNTTWVLYQKYEHRDGLNTSGCKHVLSLSLFLYLVIFFAPNFGIDSTIVAVNFLNSWSGIKIQSDFWSLRI